jgi:hypothetical protein
MASTTVVVPAPLWFALAKQRVDQGRGGRWAWKFVVETLSPAGPGPWVMNGD